jgi:hemoglobin/transferrin/lactoferrin receptor protein
MRTLFLLSTAATAIGSALIAQPVRAETPVTVSPATEVDPVVVLGTRSRRLASNVPGTVSVIDAEQIESLLAADIKDLIRFEPGVSVPPPLRGSAWPCPARAATPTPASPFAAWAVIGC